MAQKIGVNSAHNPYACAGYVPFVMGDGAPQQKSAEDQSQFKTNPWFAETSNQQRWNERTSVPVATRYMSNEQIREFQAVLAKSYKVPVDAIYVDFQAITDLQDADRGECVYLLYSMDVNTEQGPFKRGVYRIKMPIPSRIKDQFYRQQSKQTGGTLVVIKPINAPPIYEHTTLTSHSIKIPQFSSKKK